MVGDGKENQVPSPPMRSAKARTPGAPTDADVEHVLETCMRGRHTNAGVFRLSLFTSGQVKGRQASVAC